MDNILNIESFVKNHQDEKVAAGFQQYASKILRFIKTKIRSNDDAEDILQDVFYQFVEAERYLNPVEQVSAWLYRVAGNKVTDFFRKKKSVSFSHEFGSDESWDYKMNDYFEQSSEGPESKLSRKLIRIAFDEAIAELPQNQRDVFMAHEFDGISFNQMSEDTGIPVNTLLSRKRYAVLSIRKKLENMYNELIIND